MDKHGRLLTVRIAAAVYMAATAILLHPVQTQAQYLKHFNAHQFLGASNVYHVVRDRAGFLWFCTDQGLAKYDGNTMQHYTRQKGLADNMVFNVYEDRQGRIWAFCANGKYSYIQGDSVHNESNDAVLAQLPHDITLVTCMAERKDSSLYIGFASRSILHFKGKKWSWAAIHTSGSNSLLISDTIIRYTTPFGVSILAADRQHMLSSDVTGIKISKNDVIVWKIYREYWDCQTITDLYLIDSTRLIVCSKYGLEIINLISKKSIKLLQGIKVSGCYADLAGNFWITTVDNGVYFLQQELDHIQHIAGFEGIKWTFINEDRMALVRDRTLFELVADSGGIKPVTVSRNFKTYYNPLLISNDITAYFNTGGLGLRVIRKDGSIALDSAIFLKRIYAGGGPDYVGYGYGNAKYNQGYIWYFRFAENVLKDKTAIFYEHKISCIYQDTRTRDVYFISSDTLYKCNFKDRRNEPVFSSQLIAKATAMVMQDSCLLIATGEQQLFSLCLADPDRNKYLTLYDYAFPIQSLIPLSGKKVLITSNVANYILPATHDSTRPQKVMYPFSAADYENIARLGRYCLIQLDGKLYYFDTSLLNRRRSNARVYLRHLVINNREHTISDIDIKNTTKIDIQLSMGLLDFGGNNRALKYRLSGPEDVGWTRTSAMELAFVLRKAGEYAIEIAPDDNDEERTQPLIIKIHVHTPFVHSVAFFALCGLTAAGICAWIIYLIIMQRKRHFKREINYLRLEHRAINALLNPHFVFNSINNIQSLIHKSKEQDAAEYLAILSRLIRQNLENLQFNLISLENELGLIQRYIKLQNLRFGNQLSLHIDCAAADMQVHVPPLLVHTFVENAIVHGYRQRASPFLIAIRIGRPDPDHLAITIADDGIGLAASAGSPTAHQKTSMGISFNRKRLKRLSDFYKLEQSIILTDLSAAGSEGTEVVIRLYAHLKELFERKHLSAH